jgi:hypothetical protein
MAPTVTIVEFKWEDAVYLDGYLVLKDASNRSLIGLLGAIDPSPVVQVFKAHCHDDEDFVARGKPPVCLKDLSKTLEKYKVEGFGDFVV